MPALVPLLADPAWTVRWEAANNLGYLENRAALPALVRCVVEESNNHVRWRAWWAVKVTDPDGTEARVLLNNRLADVDPRVHWRAVVGLTMYGGGELLPLVAPGLSNPDPWIRWEAVNALGRLKIEDSVPLLEPMLVDPDRSIRHEALAALGAIGGRRAQALASARLADSDSRTRLRAVLALERIGGRASTDLLLARTRVETDPTVIEELRRSTKGETTRGR